MKHIRRALATIAVIACTQAAAQAATVLEPAPQPRTSIADSNAAAFKACASSPASKAVCPLKAVFGLFKLAPDNSIQDFIATNHVPRVVNTNYGWMMRVNQKSGTVRVLERFTLPEAPKTWGAGGLPHGTSADRKTISLDVTLTIYNGVISKSWDVAQGDPLGRHHITVFVDNSPPVQFEFDVMEPQ